MLKLVTLLAAVAALEVAAQETVTYRPPARDFTVAVTGERIAYVRNPADGGVLCTSQAESSVATAPRPLVVTECAQSRARTTGNVREAIDGGALER